MQAKVVYLCLMAAAAVMVALAQGNASPFIAAVIGLAWFWALHKVTWDKKPLFRFTVEHHWHRGNRGTYFPSVFEYVFAVGLPTVAVLGSFFVFAPLAFGYPYHVIDRGDGDVLYQEGWFVAATNPFTDTVRNFDRVVETGFVEASCTAVTSDGKGLRANVGATLALPFEGLPAAYTRSGDPDALKRSVLSVLCGRFSQVVGGYALAAIPTMLVLEAGTVEERRGMAELGIRYAGVIGVRNMHVHLDESR